MKDAKRTGGDKGVHLGRDLKTRCFRLIDALVCEDERSDATFESLLTRVNDLFQRKLAMEGTKSETRDLLGEVVFSRLRSAFRILREDRSAADEIRAAEWVMGMLFSVNALTDFARALDRVMLSAPRQKEDFSFAGQTNFISLEEVLQLLGGGNYNGMLALEKEDNRIDVFIRDGNVVYLDPHQIVRRVLQGGGNDYREIPLNLLRQAEDLRAREGVPILVGLARLGFVQESEISELGENFGLEILHEFLAAQDACTFFYKKLDDLPSFVRTYGHPMAVTPILLEGSKRTDDWRAMLSLFPDLDAPIEAVDNMLGRIAAMTLGVLDIKFLSMISSGTTPRKLARNVGLPLFDTYRLLVRFARDGVLVPSGDPETLAEVADTLEQTMERAFEVLDANDDDLSRESALEDALGDPFGDPLDSGDNETILDLLAKKDISGSLR